MLIITFKITEIDHIQKVLSLSDGIQIQIDDLHSVNLWKLAQVRKLIHKPLYLHISHFETSGIDTPARYAIVQSLCALHPDAITIDASDPELLELKEEYPTIEWNLSSHVPSLEKEKIHYKTFEELQTSI